MTTKPETTRTVSVSRAVPYDDRPEWDVVGFDSADPDFDLDGGRFSDFDEARLVAENLALEHDAALVVEQ